MNVGRRLRARRLRSAAGSINSGRHILESRCSERCANDAFSTSFRATLKFVTSTHWKNVPLSSGRVIVHTILQPSPAISWIELGGMPKWLLLDFGYQDAESTAYILSFDNYVLECWTYISTVKKV